jgi:hypothetical protein
VSRYVNSVRGWVSTLSDPELLDFAREHYDRATGGGSYSPQDRLDGREVYQLCKDHWRDRGHSGESWTAEMKARKPAE